MTPEQMQDAIFGNYLCAALGSLVVGLIVFAFLQEIRKERRSSQIDEDILIEGSLAAVMRKRWGIR